MIFDWLKTKTKPAKHPGLIDEKPMPGATMQGVQYCDGNDCRRRAEYSVMEWKHGSTTVLCPIHFADFCTKMAIKTMGLELYPESYE